MNIYRKIHFRRQVGFRFFWVRGLLSGHRRLSGHPRAVPTFCRDKPIREKRRNIV